MAVSSVELIVDASKAINPLKRVASETKKLEAETKKSADAFTASGREIKTAANGMKFFTDAAGRARKVNGQFVTTTEAAAAGLNNQGNAAKGASNAFNGLGKKVAGLAAAYIGLNAAQNSFRVGVSRIESERRIKFLAEGYGEVASLQDAATKAAKRFGIGQTEANRALADVFARLRPVGVGLDDIVSVYNGFNTAARISGSTAVESANAFRQLSQALGSGALRGDEFNSISEQVPGILTAISKETGVAQGELREFAAKGGITADIVIRALKRIETEGAAQLEAALGGPAQAIRDFQNAAEDVQVALTKDIVPQMAEVFRGLAELIVNLEGPIKFIGGVAANTLNQINSLITQATQPAAVAARRDIEAGLIPTNMIAAFTGGDVRKGAKQLFGEEELKELEARAREFAQLRGEGFQETLLQFMQDRLKTMDAAAMGPTVTISPPVILSSLKTNTKPGAGKSDAEIEEERLKKIAEATADRVRSLRQQTLLAAALTEEERTQFERQIQIADILENRQGLSQKQLKTELQATLALFEQQDATKALTEEQKRLADAKKKAQEEEQQRLQELNKKYKQIGDAIKNNITNTIMDAIEGTKSLGESAIGVLKQLARQFLTMGINQGFNALGQTGGILGKLFGGGKASGGTVQGGRSYVVGERGPELFTPNRTGSIAPSGSFGGANVTVNVDASGSSVEGDADQAAQLGKAIGVAVQQELIKQKRPGGLLTV